MPKDKKPEPLPEGLRPEDFQADVDFAAETLSGDVRDTILSHVKAMRVPWAYLNEAEQAEKILAFMTLGEKVVRQVVDTVVRVGFPSLIVSIGSYRVDKGVDIKVSAGNSVDNVLKLAQHGKGAAVLVLAEGGDFYGERRPATPDKAKPGQPDPPLDGGPK